MRSTAESERKSHDVAPHDDARATLDAIAAGHVDAVVVHGPHGPQVYHLEGPDQPFRTLVENMQEGAITVSEQGQILYANSHLLRLLGHSVEDVIGEPLSRFVPSRYQATLAEMMREGARSPVRGQLRLSGREDSIPVQLTLSPLTGGAAPASCGIVFDLREREQAEQAHSALIAAEQASLAKDQFLAILSHELRSPLNAMLGWAQILLNDQQLNESARRAAQTIERNARTQAQLIGDLLDISRIIAGKLNLEMSNLELGALTEAALATARPAVQARRLQLRHDLSDDVDVYGDPTRLQQIVTNLLNNAIKFSDEGGRIDVTLRRDGREATLTVADTGVGISPTMLSRVFDVFQQAGSQQRRKGGLGLGLAIARQLAEAHGGSLQAFSEGEGKGSTFTLRLPLTVKSARPPAGDYRLQGELAGVRVLAVDDEQDNLDLVCYLLEQAGATVISASSAEEALLALQQQGGIDLMVSDIGLQDQDGLHLMREVRARGHLPTRLPAIALTGYAGRHDVHLVSAAGYQRHLAKPVDAATLIKTASELLRAARAEHKP
jgi:PAS domain S-box-containing protein